MMATMNCSIGAVLLAVAVVTAVVSAVSPRAGRVPQRRVPSAYNSNVPKWMAVRGRRALQRRQCPSTNYYDYVLRKRVRRSEQSAPKLRQHLGAQRFARCRQLARAATIVRCRQYRGRRRMMQRCLNKPPTRRSEDTKVSRAACKELKGSEMIHNCIRDHFRKDEYQLSRYVQQYGLPTAHCEAIGKAPGRCFKLLELRNKTSSTLGPYRWKGDKAMNEKQFYHPQFACIHMNYGRAATVNSESILAFVHGMIKKPGRDQTDVFDATATFVDGYPIHFKKEWGSNRKADWRYDYAPMIKGPSTKVTMQRELWGAKEPNGADSKPASMCVSINYDTGKFDDVRCRDFQYAACEYSLEMPHNCVPLANEMGRCFKIKNLEVTNYGAMWQANGETKGKYSGNEFQARECHDRTPGRLANIDTAEALKLALELMSLKRTNKDTCVMVDGMPSYYEESVSESVIKAELERRWKGSTTKRHWKAGGGVAINNDRWASGQPDNQHGNEACACLNPTTKGLHDEKCNKQWRRIICEYDTPIGGLPAQNEQVGKTCKMPLVHHIYKTCEAMKSGFYQFSCPCKARLEEHLKKRGNWAEGCCKQGCPQKYFVYHCCSAYQWFNRVSARGDKEEQIFDEIRKLD